MIERGIEEHREVDIQMLKVVKTTQELEELYISMRGLKHEHEHAIRDRTGLASRQTYPHNHALKPAVSHDNDDRIGT